jgi:hypothetical protein
MRLLYDLLSTLEIPKYAHANMCPRAQENMRPDNTRKQVVIQIDSLARLFVCSPALCSLFSVFTRRSEFLQPRAASLKSFCNYLSLAIKSNNQQDGA